MELREILFELENTIKDTFGNESSGHDIFHLIRTCNLALNIQKTEGGDEIVIGIAALLHDVHRIIQNETGVYCSPADSLDEVQKMISGIDISELQKKKIIHSIEFHEEYDFTETGKTVQDIETLILQDADNLDALGAIGIGRTFAYSGAHNVIMWQPEIPLESKHYADDQPDPSTIHHFYSKLLKLKDNMNTPTALKLAQKRHDFMETFLIEFFKEWEGIR